MKRGGLMLARNGFKDFSARRVSRAAADIKEAVFPFLILVWRLAAVPPPQKGVGLQMQCRTSLPWTAKKQGLSTPLLSSRVHYLSTVLVSPKVRYRVNSRMYISTTLVCSGVTAEGADSSLRWGYWGLLLPLYMEHLPLLCGAPTLQRKTSSFGVFKPKSAALWESHIQDTQRQVQSHKASVHKLSWASGCQTQCKELCKMSQWNRCWSHLKL